MSNQPDNGVIIVGAGGHGKVVAEALRAAGTSVLGFTDSSLPPTAEAGGPPLLGDDSVLETYDHEAVRLAMGVGSTRPDDARQKIYERLCDLGFRFATVVHPAATIAADVALEEGCQVMAGAVVQSGCRIGAGTIVNTRASVDHDCLVGRFVHIAPGATLSGGVRLDGRLPHRCGRDGRTEHHDRGRRPCDRRRGRYLRRETERTIRWCEWLSIRRRPRSGLDFSVAETRR